MDTSIQVTVPKSWLAGPVAKLKGTFCDNFNKKHEAHAIDRENARLERPNGEVLEDEDVVEEAFVEGKDNVVFVRRGKSGGRKPQPAAPAAPAAAPPTTTTPTPAPAPNPNVTEVVIQPGADGLVMCQRFGCKKRFTPGANEGPCCYHAKPPVFHETRKYWACCPDKVGWDWETFEAIKGCQHAAEHTNVKQQTRVMGGSELRAERDASAPQPLNAAAAASSSAPAAPKSGLEKLSALRSALTQMGMSGATFDELRDKIKRVHEDKEEKKIWDKVCSIMVERIERVLREEEKPSSS